MKSSICKKNGIRIRGKTYQFRLDKVTADAPARSYILGVKNHRSKKPCQRCHVIGTQVFRSGFASTSVQRSSSRRTNAYLDFNAPRRTVEEMLAGRYGSSPVPECGPECTSGGCWDEDDESIGAYEHIDCSDDEYDEMILPDKQYIRHQTLLLKIPGFDLVRFVVLDYLHLVCLGVMSKLLDIWKREDDILSSEQKKKIDELLTRAKKYTPAEFQRQPEILENLANWKGTQLRDFMLYVGVPVLNGSMHNTFVQHFIYLVVAMRLMVRKVSKNRSLQETLELIANSARQCLYEFVNQSIELYGPEFVIYNVHSLIHVPDDYELFGPLDLLSGYIFESFNGKVKKYVSGGSADPLKQILNVYSDRLGLGEFCEEREQWDEVEEFFENPEVCYRQNSVFNSQDVQQNSEMPYDDENYEQYLQMKFRNFVLRSDNDRDCFCTVFSPNNGVHFMKVQKILKEVHANEYYIIGNYYKKVHSLFEIPCSSLEVGMALCHKPSTKLYMFPISQLQNKCFAFPTKEEGLSVTEWAFLEMLH